MPVSPIKSGPDFLCVGQQKAGTGWLYDQLQSHRDAWMPPIKELNYFAGGTFRDKYLNWLADYRKQSAPFWRHPLWKLRRTVKSGEQDAAGPGRIASRLHNDLDAHFWGVFERGAKSGDLSLDWYRDLFPRQNGLLSGDITPGYTTLSPGQITRIKHEFPGIKIILFIRSPVGRAKSGISMRIRKGHMKPGDQNDKKKVMEYLTSKSAMERSFPSLIWNKWSEVFGRESCRYWFLEDIRDNAFQTRDEIFKFLSLDGEKTSLPADYNRKSGKSKFSVSPEVTAMIEDFYADEIAKCAELFGSHANYW